MEGVAAVVLLFACVRRVVGTPWPADRAAGGVAT